MYEDLAIAIEELSVDIDMDSVASLIGLLDQLRAKTVALLGEVDAAALWELDGATSLLAWLKDRGGRSPGEAKRLADAAARLRRLPVTAAAYESGQLGGGQVDVIVAAVDKATVDIFAEQEAALIPAFVALSVADTNRAAHAWKARAKALIDGTEPADETGMLHVSKVGDRVVVGGEFTNVDGEIVTTALRVADIRPQPGEPRLPVAERRAQALVEVCRFFLDHQKDRPASRHRPHVNVIVNLADAVTGGPGQTADGLPVPAPAMAALMCDSVIHRCVIDAKSGRLDYGVATHTISPHLFNALLVRDRGCRFPGCDRPPNWCEGHHLLPFDNGGPTRPENLVLACSRHHHLLHKPKWKAKLHPDGTLTVTDPNGRTRTSHPPGHLWDAA